MKMFFKAVQNAWTTAFDITTTIGAQINKLTVQEAIEFTYNLVTSSSRSFTQFSYGGNANTGRYLEFFPAIDTNEAPLYVVNALSVYSIVARTTAVNATCTIGFYNDTTLLHTITFSAVKQVIVTATPPTPIFTLPATGQLKVKIDSGSIAKPHLYITGQGG